MRKVSSTGKGGAEGLSRTLLAAEGKTKILRRREKRCRVRKKRHSQNQGGEVSLLEEIETSGALLRKGSKAIRGLFISLPRSKTHRKTESDHRWQGKKKLEEKARDSGKREAKSPVNERTKGPHEGRSTPEKDDLSLSEAGSTKRVVTRAGKAGCG